jgi:hypothetical protein
MVIVVMHPATPAMKNRQVSVFVGRIFRRPIKVYLKLTGCSERGPVNL